MWADSGGSELGVNVAVGLDVASSNIKLHAVAGLGPGLVMSISGVTLVLVASIEVVAEMKLGISAGQNSGTSGDHIVSESKLLAVKSEGVLVLIKVVLGVAASILSMIDNTNRVDVSCFDGSVVLVDVLSVLSNSIIVVSDVLVDLVNVVVEVVDGSLECLESNKHLSLNLDSFLVVVLVPNLMILVESVDLSVEVSSWELLTVLATVIRLSVVIIDREVWLSGLIVITETGLSFEGSDSIE